MEKNIKNLNEEEFKNMILESHKRQIELFFRMSQAEIIILYQEIEEMIGEDKIYQFIEESKEREIILNAYNNLMKSFNKINQNMTNEEIEEEIKKLLNTRKSLEKLFAAINAYDIEMAYILELTNYYMMRIMAKGNYKGREIDENEINEIVEDISFKLSQHLSEYEEFSELVSQILAILPFRMTKLKFYNILEENLTRSLKNYSIDYAEEIIQKHKLNFDSSYMGDYGVLFAQYFTEIQYYKNIDLKNKDYEELGKLDLKMDILRDAIIETSTLIQFLGIFTNKLIALYLIKERLALDLSKNSILSDWLEYRENPRDSLMKELVLKARLELEDIEIKFYEEKSIIDKLDEEIEELSEEMDEAIHDIIMENVDIIKWVGDNDFNKYELLFPANDEIITEDYLNQLIDSLIGYINRSISNMGNIERKIRMRRLLTYIELPFGEFEEFIEYIYYALDERVVSKEEILFTLDGLYFIVHDELQDEIDEALNEE